MYIDRYLEACEIYQNTLCVLRLYFLIISFPCLPPPCPAVPYPAPPPQDIPDEGPARCRHAGSAEGGGGEKEEVGGGEEETDGRTEDAESQGGFGYQWYGRSHLHSLV